MKAVYDDVNTSIKRHLSLFKNLKEFLSAFTWVSRSLKLAGGRGNPQEESTESGNIGLNRYIRDS